MPRDRLRKAGWCAWAAAIAAACGGGGRPRPTPPAPESVGNPERGRQLVATKAQPACGTCHIIPGVEGATGGIGPSLKGVATRAATRVHRKPTVAYLRESLARPTAYVVPDYQPVMPSFRDQFSDAELDDIVAFLLTLR